MRFTQADGFWMKESAKDVVPKLTIVIGGAASGKSSYGEQIVIRSGRPRIYLATAQAYDAEMRAKIADHQQGRGGDWTTIEAPLDIAPVVLMQPPEAVVLLDCATMWLSNILLDGRDIAHECARLIDALAHAPCPVVVVTNEVGAGIVPENALARQFRNEQGRLNQLLAAQADCVVAVMAGLPLPLKGTLAP